MQLAIDAKALRAATAAAAAVAKPSSIPILGHCHLEAFRGGKVTLSGTDLNSLITVTTEAVVIAPGATAVDARVLNALAVKAPPSSRIEMTLERRASGGDRLAIRFGKSAFSCPAMDPEDFPTITPGSRPTHVSCTGAELADALDRVAFCIATEETRPAITGLYWHEHNGRVRLTSTDAARMAVVDTSIDAPKGMPGVVIPRAAVHELRKLAAANEGPCTVSVHPATVTLEAEATRYTARTIETSYPDYTRVVPSDKPAASVAVNPGQLAAAADLVATLGGVAHALVFECAGGGLRVSQLDPVRGEAEDICLTDGPCGVGSFGLRSRFLTDALASFEGPNPVSLEWRGDGLPIVLRSQDGGHTHVLMPMRPAHR